MKTKLQAEVAEFETIRLCNVSRDQDKVSSDKETIDETGSLMHSSRETRISDLQCLVSNILCHGVQTGRSSNGRAEQIFRSRKWPRIPFANSTMLSAYNAVLSYFLW